MAFDGATVESRLEIVDGRHDGSEKMEVFADIVSEKLEQDKGDGPSLVVNEDRPKWDLFDGLASPLYAEGAGPGKTLMLVNFMLFCRRTTTRLPDIPVIPFGPIVQFIGPTPVLCLA